MFHSKHHGVAIGNEESLVHDHTAIKQTHFVISSIKNTFDYLGIFEALPCRELWFLLHQIQKIAESFVLVGDFFYPLLNKRTSNR